MKRPREINNHSDASEHIKKQKHARQLSNNMMEEMVCVIELLASSWNLLDGRVRVHTILACTSDRDMFFVITYCRL